MKNWHLLGPVSMVDGELFDKLAQLASVLRKRPGDPFGGIQVSGTNSMDSASNSSAYG